MYPFSQAVTPAVKNHLEAQLSFFNDISKSLFHTAQQYGDLNIQLAQTMLEESTTAGQQILTAHRPTDMFSAAAAHAQPTAEKLRAYQQHISRIAADTQTDLARVAEDHIAETARTAKELADDVARATREETDKTMRAQQDAARKFTDPFQNYADGAQRSRGNEVRGGSTMQNGNQDGSDAHGGMHGAAAASQAAASQAGKQQTGRKES
ncbi:phasin family protein [Rugamonas sp.]|uniref:phasin family protein n=1 Tax=Rugamonas sp. TaxID=1926287 RepID=UPI0025FFAE7F|nr:phasin family protein [Rugamonas sp.]